MEHPKSKIRKPKSPRPKTVLVLWIAAGLLLALLAAAFITAWLALPPPGAMNCLERTEDSADLCWFPIPGCNGTFQGFASRHEAVPFAFNQAGFRGPEPATQQPDIRVAVFGASTIFGYGLTDEQTWRPVVTRELELLLAGRRVEVLNLGVVGFDVRQQLAYASLHLDLQADLYLFTVDAHLLMPTYCDAWWSTCSLVANLMPPLRWHLLHRARAMEAPADGPIEETLELAGQWRRRHPELRIAAFLHSSLGNDESHAARVTALAHAGFEIIDLSAEMEKMFDPHSPDFRDYWLANMEGWSAKGHELVGTLLARRAAPLLSTVPKQAN